MGGGSSRPSGPTKASPIIREEPKPIPGVISFGFGDAQGCEWKGRGECRLVVPHGISSSGAKLYREQGTVTKEECDRFMQDQSKVANNQMAFEEYKQNALAGKYWRHLGNGYCGQYEPLSREKMKELKTFNTVRAFGGVFMTADGGIWAGGNPISIRKISPAGGYSSITKLFIKPSIPFKIVFNGETFTISMMTLFHPSPVRLENVQHDAVLTLGDPGAENRAKGSGSTDAVILIPLVGSLNGGPSGEFISKIARYMTAVLQPDPVSGQYKTVDIPTGNDWDLSKLFPGTPSNGETVVTAGYYAWSASGAMVKSTTPEVQANPFPQADILTYRWVPSGATNLRYLMLKDPVPVNVFDLQTVRMLPATPPDQAIDPFIPSTLTAVGDKECKTTPTAAGRESMTNPGTCDPFAGVQSNALTQDALVQIVIGVLTTFGVFLAIYFAVKLFANTDWGFKLPRWGHLFGNYAINAPLAPPDKIPPSARFTSRAEAEEESAGKKAEARLSAVPSTINPLLKPRETPALTPDDLARIETAGKEAEAEAKKRAEEEARLIEEARLEAEADAERARREAQEPAPLPTEEESRRLEAIGPAGTGLFSGDDLKTLRQDAKQEETLRAQTNQAETEAETMRKTVAEMNEGFKRAEEARKQAEDAEAKARERAVIEAKDLEETAPVRPGRRTRTTFAKTVKVPPPSLAEAVKAKEAEAKATQEAEEAKAAKEAAEKEAEEAKAAKEAAEKEAADKEAEVKRLSEEAAKSASKVAERQADLLKRAEEERQRQLKEYEAKAKEEEARVFRPTSGRATAAVPAREAAPPVRSPREHAPPTAEEIQTVLDDVAESTKTVKVAGRALPAASKSTLSESETKTARDKLTGLRDKAFDAVASATQAMNLRRSLWKNRSAWMRFEEEKKQSRFLASLVKKIVEYREAIESSGLDGLVRLGYANSLTELTVKTLRLLEESKRRMNTLEDNAVPPLVKGGRRRMKRKSTRRYVA